MTKQKSMALHVFFSIIALVMTSLFMVLAYRTYFADSEIWLLTVSQHIFTHEGLHSIYYKWSFHLATYLFSHFAPTELAVYYWARIGWGVIAILSLFLTSRLFTKVYKKPQLFWPLFIFLLSSSLFLNQGFRIRGDIFCLFLHMLYLSIYFHALENKIRQHHFYFLTLINIILALSTPKFIIFTLCQTILCLYWAFGATKRRQLVWLTISTLTFPIILGSVVILLSFFIPKAPPLLSAIISGADFYLKSYNPQFINPVIFSLEDFFHLQKFVLWSAVHALFILIWLIGFFFLVFQKKSNTSFLLKGLQIYTGTLFLCVIAYNQKLPFFLASFLTPVLAQSFFFIFNYIEKNAKLLFTPLLITVTLAAIVTFATNFWPNFTLNTNMFQRDVINALDWYQAGDKKKLKIYDIIGILPRKNNVFLFVGPSEVSHKTKIIEDILKIDPDIIILTYKFSFLEPEFPPVLEKHWVPVGKDVWVKGKYLSPTKTPHIFMKPHLHDGKAYWLLPAFKEKHIIDKNTHMMINSETLQLDKNLQLTQSDIQYVAVPQKYLTLVLTNIEPIPLPGIPSLLFRYDTAF